MKYLLYGLVIIILSFIVISEAPPALPMEVWGQVTADGSPVASGLDVNATIDGDDYAQPTTTGADGYFDVIISGLDRPLTYLDDPTCATHWAADEACVPCSTNPNDADYCIEGPQAGDDVKLKIDGKNVDSSVVLQGGEILNKNFELYMLVKVDYNLYSGWNLISIPVILQDNDPSSVFADLNGRVTVFEWDPLYPPSFWRGYDTDISPDFWDLNNIDSNKGYWVKLESDQKWSISGEIPENNVIEMYEGWNLVGFQFYEDSIENMMSRLQGRVTVFEWDPLYPPSFWRGADSDISPDFWDLNNIKKGKGYWVKVESRQNWEAGTE